MGRLRPCRRPRVTRTDLQGPRQARPSPESLMSLTASYGSTPTSSTGCACHGSMSSKCYKIAMSWVHVIKMSSKCQCHGSHDMTWVDFALAPGPDPPHRPGGAQTLPGRPGLPETASCRRRHHRGAHCRRPRHMHVMGPCHRSVIKMSMSWVP